jgi:hypothetical protein
MENLFHILEEAITVLEKKKSKLGFEISIFCVQAISYVLAYRSLSRHLTSNTELSQLPHLIMNLSRRHNSNVTRSILGRVTREDL